MRHDETTSNQESVGDTVDDKIKNHEVIIVGAGPAGLCAALYAGRSEMDAVMIEAGFPGGQLLLTEHVDDYPGIEDNYDFYQYEVH